MRRYERGLYVRREPAPKPEALPAQRRVLVPLERGETALVSVGEPVRLGQRIADGAGETVPLHAGVSGVVAAILPHSCAGGRRCTTLVLENDGKNRPDPSIHPRALLDRIPDEPLLGFLYEAGIRLPDGKPLAAVIAAGEGRPLAVSAMDPEPGACAGEAALLYDGEALFSGIWLLARLLKAKQVSFVVGSGRREAIRAAKRWMGNKMELCTVGGPGPAGHPQRLSALLGGALVLNAASASAAAHACYEGIPVIRETVCVCRREGTVLFDVPLGTPVRAVLQAAGCRGETVLWGGPLTGTRLESLDVPVVKGTAALTVLERRNPPPRTSCIRCGRCERVCPAELRPWLSQGRKRRDWSGCLRCGACQYVCPAGLPLVAQIEREARSFG